MTSRPGAVSFITVSTHLLLELGLKLVRKLVGNWET